MRHSRLYGIMTGMLSCMLVLSVSSCVKDDFDRYHDVSDALSFKVEVSDGWSEAASASSTTSIRRMSQSTDAEPLYLVTKVSDSAPVSAESGVVTRGTPVENDDPMKTGGFGLSAICYTGSWPAEGSTNSWTTNFAHNLNVTMQDGKWKAPGKLEWPGSGNIRFFAYYPYSEYSNGCITHSKEDAKGAPVLTYTVPDDVKKQPDLLWVVADHSGKSTGDGSVALKFQHALTAVKIKCGKDMLAGKISKVEISGIYSKGELVIGSDKWTVLDNPEAKYTISDEITLSPSRRSRRDTRSQRHSDSRHRYRQPDLYAAAAETAGWCHDDYSIH